LIEAASRRTPNGNTVGRGMRSTGKMLACWSRSSCSSRRTKASVGRPAPSVRTALGVPGVTAEVFVPEVANNVPHIRITWDGADEKTAAAVVKAMKDGEPSIGIRSEAKTLVLGVWMMQPGEDKVVARRLRQVLEKKA
jgi:L-seryl-tRNA(Ser) seleniumtransferase